MNEITSPNILWAHFMNAEAIAELFTFQTTAK